MTEVYDVPYMQRTRDYYRAQGYEKDYRWAQAKEAAPFSSLKKPLNESTLALITTAMPDTEQGRAERAVYSTLSNPIPASMYTEELSWDKSATHTEDVGSFLPLQQLGNLVVDGKLGTLAPRFHSVPTTYSQRATNEEDAPKILQRCIEDEVDIALLVPL